MGYELKLYIIEPSGITGEDGIYCSVIAMVDVCKPGYDSALYALNTKENNTKKFYFYGEDGNNPIVEDRYGDKIRFASVDDTLEAAIKDNKVDKYRRFDILIACLKAVKNSKFGEPLVAFYGY